VGLGSGGYFVSCVLPKIDGLTGHMHWAHSSHGPHAFVELYTSLVTDYDDGANVVAPDRNRAARVFCVPPESLRLLVQPETKPKEPTIGMLVDHEMDAINRDKKSQTLTTLRETLLPKLLSGDISTLLTP
jgi:hypothetical protein